MKKLNADKLLEKAQSSADPKIWAAAAAALERERRFSAAESCRRRARYYAVVSVIDVRADYEANAVRYVTVSGEPKI